MPRGKFIDLTGQRFERLTVIERDKNRKGTFWICVCDCGKQKSVSSVALRSGLTKSCGCLNKEIISKPKDLSDFIGKRFGALVVKERVKNYVAPSGQTKPQWLCQCDCGKETVVTGADLRSGHTKSCGCLPTKIIGSGLYNLIGQRFGKLVVIERAGDYHYKSGGKINSSPQWLCQCDCGNRVVVQGGNLRSGNTVNCGCEHRSSKSEIEIADFFKQHGIKYFREYSFEDLRNKSGNLLRFDFAILDGNNRVVALVEYQGKQHYADCGWFGKYQREYSDGMKRKYCLDHNILLHEIKFDENLENALTNLLNQLNLN